MKSQNIRKILFASLVAMTALMMRPSSGYAATPAETFISDNIQSGLGILNDKRLDERERSDQFESLLLGMTDMRRIAVFTLSEYAKTASQADQDAFIAAFRNYSVAVYHSYLGKYAGQTLKVTGSIDRAPGDIIVDTIMINPRDDSGLAPLKVQFRVRTDTGKPVLTDFSVAGIWLAIEERDQFAAVLSKSHGDIQALTAHLRNVTDQYQK